MREDYEQLLRLPHPEPRNRARMKRSDRAAQFAPFAALSGFDGDIAEAGRLTGPEVFLAGEALEELDRRQADLARRLGERPEVTVTWFRPDPRKAGGQQITFRGSLKQIDEAGRRLIFTDGTAIDMENILALKE